MSKELITTDGELISLPSIFSTERTKGLQLLNKPLDYRMLLGKDTGVFTCNGIKQGKELKVRVINYRDEENVIFGDEYKEPITCTQAIVVDADGNIGTLVFVTETARDRFLTVADYCQAKKTPLPTQWLKIALEKTTSKEKGFVFHTPKIEVEPSTKDEVMELIEFIKLVPKCLNVFRELPKATETAK